MAPMMGDIVLESPEDVGDIVLGSPEDVGDSTWRVLRK